MDSTEPRSEAGSLYGVYVNHIYKLMGIYILTMKVVQNARASLGDETAV